jgi:hypothetical protein
MKEEKSQDTLQVYFSWEVLNKAQHDRSPIWYIVTSLLGGLLIIYSIYTSNFLFAVMIILVAFIVIINDAVPPRKVRFAITDIGVIVGSSVYDWRDLESFYLMYEPPYIKRLYFEPKGLRSAVSIELYDNDPIEVRDFLLQFLPENTERQDEPLQDALERFLKL